MADMMTFPNTVEEFMEQYKIVDAEKVYTNGAEMVPIFRMRQWFEHELSNKPPTVDNDFGDLVSRQYLLNEYDRQHEGPPGGARKIIETAPPATLYGYSIEHLAAVANLMRRHDVTPEKMASMVNAVYAATRLALDMMQRQAEAAVNRIFSGGSADNG